MITKFWKIRFLFLLVIFIFPESLLAQEDGVNHVDTLPFLKCKVISWATDIAEDYIYSYYPVVVSPDQNWVAYAIKPDEDGMIELWVAKLNYSRKKIETT